MSDAKEEPSEVPDYYMTDDGLKSLAVYLRSSKGVKIKQGVLEGKRIDYFKGSRLVETMIGKSKTGAKWPSNLPGKK